MAVLSATGTESSCVATVGKSGRFVARWQMMAVRFAPADEPPIAIREMSRLSFSVPVVEMAQRTDSQQSSTAAGKGFSGASLKVKVSRLSWD